ncbi:hypothetical protein CBS101457_005681 [Exobasidium rhododendri]|nr:hypothetical protein CBS101457_005681 [Exobasidium rhododendri]
MITPFSTAFLLLAVSLIVSVEASPVINSPTTLVQCQPAALTWTDALPPVYISAVEGTSTSSNPLLTFQPQDEASGSLTWPKVNITEGTTLTFIINDSKGVNNFSGQVTVKPGASDCTLIGGDASDSSDSTAAATTATAAGSTSGSVSAGTSKNGTSTPSTSSTTTADTATSPSTSKSTTTNTTTTPSTAQTISATGTGTNSTSKKTTTSSTSGTTALDSSSASVFVGTFAALAGVLIASGLF